MSSSDDKIKRIRSLVGQIPEPSELYGRGDFIQHLWRMLDANNILLLAPRRFGKSGVMRHILLQPEEGFLPLSFELEDVDSPEEFVWRVTRELLAQDKTRAFFSSTKRLPSVFMSWVKDTFDEAGFEGAKVKFKGSIKSDWQDAAKRMLVELEKADKTIVFLFDELPAMLDRMIETRGPETAVDFLAWFRTVRLAQKDVLRRHRFVVAGSVGIDQILKKLGATDRLVDFTRLTVKPLDSTTAKKLTHDLASSFEIKWHEALTDKLIQLAGAPVPFFIHIFFSELGQLSMPERNSLTAQKMEVVYKERVLGPTCRHYFQHYSTRLKRYGSSGEKAAFAILRAVASQGRVSRPVLFDIYSKAHGKGASDQGFDDVMADLEYDWYLRLDPATNEFHFLLKVMRDWWCRWHPLPVGGTKMKSKGKR